MDQVTETAWALLAVLSGALWTVAAGGAGWWVRSLLADAEEESYQLQAEMVQREIDVLREQLEREREVGLAQRDAGAPMAAQLARASGALGALAGGDPRGARRLLLGAPTADPSPSSPPTPSGGADGPAERDSAEGVEVGGHEDAEGGVGRADPE